MIASNINDKHKIITTIFKLYTVYPICNAFNINIKAVNMITERIATKILSSIYFLRLIFFLMKP